MRHTLTPVSSESLISAGPDRPLARELGWLRRTPARRFALANLAAPSRIFKPPLLFFRFRLELGNEHPPLLGVNGNKR
jgi:hypothetical protein